jgi:hypothetical protein
MHSVRQISSPQTADISIGDYTNKLSVTNSDIPSYNGYARDVLRKWLPESDGIESTRSVSHPSRSQSLLNLRSGGTRGSDSNAWQRPEADLSSRDVKPPSLGVYSDMYKVGAHVNAMSKHGLEVKMGNNFVEQVMEGPKTGHRRLAERVENHHRSKGNLNEVFEEHYGANLYSKNISVPQSNPNMNILEGDSFGTSSARFKNSDQSNTNDSVGGSIKSYDIKAGKTASTFNGVLGTNLQIEDYNKLKSGGSSTTGKLTGGGVLKNASTNQSWTDSGVSKRQTRKVLIHDLASRIAVKANQPLMDGKFSNSKMSNTSSAVHPTIYKDLTRTSTEDQRRDSNAVSDRIVNSVASLISKNTNNIAKYASVNVTDNDHLTLVANVSRKPGSVSRDSVGINRHSTRDANAPSLESVVLSYAGQHKSADPTKAIHRSDKTVTAPNVSNISNQTVGGLKASADLSKMAGYTNITISPSAYSDSESINFSSGKNHNITGLRKTDMMVLPSTGSERVVCNYSNIVPVKTTIAIATAQANADQELFGVSTSRNTNKIESEVKWHSATTGKTTIGAEATKTFGANSDVGTPGMSIGAKRLRANKNGVACDLPDGGVREAM